MPLYIWACPLVQALPPRRPVWEPKVLTLMTEPAVIEWVTTSGGAGSWAAGVISATTVQAAILEADPDIHIIISTATTTVGNLPGPQRTRLRTFCTDAGISSPPNGETLRSVMERLITHNDPVKTLAYLEGRAV
jgi:hypothetical protein